MEKYIFFREDLCYICHNKMAENYICSDCLSHLEFIDGEFNLGDNNCYYPLFYNNFLQEIIQNYKFRSKTYLVKPMSIILAEHVFNKFYLQNIDYISYIPMDKTREYRRGYNQVKLLAEYLSYIMKIPLAHSLIKAKITKEQNKLGAQERHKNLKGSFIINQDCIIKGKKILLIDDLVTTGSTLKEANKILVNSGAYVNSLVLTSSRISKE